MMILVMGVTGSGKTTIGAMLAAELGWPFFDADDFHSPANVRKMSSGIPLTDEDRRPWLGQLRTLIAEQRSRGENGVLACSALKRSYRDILSSEDGVLVVYLRADPNLIEKRLAARKDHFMSRSLIESQFRALEAPESAITVPADWRPGKIVDVIRSKVGV
jgi:gluconokinase